MILIVHCAPPPFAWLYGHDSDDGKGCAMWLTWEAWVRLCDGLWAVGRAKTDDRRNG